MLNNIKGKRNLLGRAPSKKTDDFSGNSKEIEGIFENRMIQMARKEPKQNIRNRNFLR